VKVLIIRFSSFGDIVQALAAAEALKRTHPKCVIHWIVREDFAEFISASPLVDKVWSFSRSAGLPGLLTLAKTLNSEGFSHVYDAHNNLRSNILSQFVKSEHFVRRPKNRWDRFLEFKLGQKRFKMPFVGQKSYVSPLIKWDVSWVTPTKRFFDFTKYDQSIKSKFNLPNSYVTLVPSAAWEKKRWPTDHWKSLMELLNGKNLVVLGGKEDVFIHELLQSVSVPAINLTGKTTLLESCSIISSSQVAVSADTGLMHVADAQHVPTVSLIGPSAFGYPAQASSKVLEVELWCKPCSKDGRGGCKNPEYQKCMKDISPERVLNTIQDLGVSAK
jgi:ADP-heptose:LPS heptosyltransferase